MEGHDDKLYCPNCGSSQFVANKKGFGAKKALLGGFLTGGIGLFAGFIGSNKIKITCLKCGHTYKPGDLKTKPLSPKELEQIKEQEDNDKSDGIAVFFLVTILVLVLILIMLDC